MRRRDVIAMLGGATAVWSIAARAQQSGPTRRMGVLMGGDESDPESRARIAALRQGLAALGWQEGHNLTIEWRWGVGDVTRMPSLAAELVALGPDLIIANGTPALVAIQRATRSIPIVFVLVNDPVDQGFIASLAHPGGNTTGFTFVEYSMIGKLLEMLLGVAPRLSRAAVMYNPESTPFTERYLRALAAEPPPYGVELTGAPIRAVADIDPVISKLSQEPASGLIVPPDIFTIAHRDVIMHSTAERRVPAIYSYRQFVREGGLISYGADTADIYRRSAAYVDRIFKGANPGELPAQAPEKFEFAINLTTARTLGLTVPPGLLAIADEVVE
jgi:putative tryptophan/tyrosine transport system substrate-binding protein